MVPLTLYPAFKSNSSGCLALKLYSITYKFVGKSLWGFWKYNTKNKKKLYSSFWHKSKKKRNEILPFAANNKEQRKNSQRIFLVHLPQCNVIKVFCFLFAANIMHCNGFIYQKVFRCIKQIKEKLLQIIKLNWNKKRKCQRNVLLYRNLYFFYLMCEWNAKAKHLNLSYWWRAWWRTGRR